MKPEPYAHQTRAVAEARRLVSQGRRAPLLVSPTGSGKTNIACMIAEGALERGGRVACFAHRDELITQIHERMRQFDIPTGPGTRVEVMTYQTAVARGEVPEATVAIFDEAHHIAADEWKRVADAYAGSIRIGLTATPERADGLGLGHAFDSMVIAAQYSELLANDPPLIVPCNVVAPAAPLKPGEIIASPVDAYRTHGRGPAVVFAPHVKAATEFRDEFRAAGISADVVHAKGRASGDVDAALERYARGETRVLCNVAILTEGWDSPQTETIILARGCGSAGLFIQMTGRALRPYPGKTSATLIDLAGVSFTHGSPTEDRLYSLEGVGIQRMQGPGVTFCRKCGAVSGTCACVTDAGELLTPEVVGDASQLKPWIAAMREEPDDRRVARLRKWLEEAKAKGHKPGAALFKFKAVYGHWPTAALRAEASR